jgi:hypothetical protein
MKTHLVKTYYEVRTKGDGEFDWFRMEPEMDNEHFYDPQNRESAKAYAKVVGGFVVEVKETTIDTHTL